VQIIELGSFEVSDGIFRGYESKVLEKSTHQNGRPVRRVYSTESTHLRFGHRGTLVGLSCAVGLNTDVRPDPFMGRTIVRIIRDSAGSCHGIDRGARRIVVIGIRRSPMSLRLRGRETSGGKQNCRGHGDQDLVRHFNLWGVSFARRI
jgi:hypothetical protein